jgi:hypothetical protein
LFTALGILMGGTMEQQPELRVYVRHVVGGAVPQRDFTRGPYYSIDVPDNADALSQNMQRAAVRYSLRIPVDGFESGFIVVLKEGEELNDESHTLESTGEMLTIDGPDLSWVLHIKREALDRARQGNLFGEW